MYPLSYPFWNPLEPNHLNAPYHTMAALALRRQAGAGLGARSRRLSTSGDSSKPSHLPPHLGGAVGAVTGAAASLTGLGGAVLILPTLSNLTAMPARKITGVTLVGTLATCATGCW